MRRLSQAGARSPGGFFVWSEPVEAPRRSWVALHDVVHVVCCFSYMNRLADGLGVTARPEAGSGAERLLGADRVAAHRRWASGGG